MRFVSGWSRLVAPIVVVGLLMAGGVVLTGCNPATQEPTGTGGPSGPPVTGPAPTPEVTVPTEEAQAPKIEPAPAPEPAEKKQEGAQEEKQEEKQEEQKEMPQAAAAAPGPAELDLAPPLSKFAPAKDLAAQVPEYVEDLEEAVETEPDYNDNVENLAKRSNTLILIALGLGLHDEDNPYKKAAPALIKAAQQVAAAKDFASAQAAVAAVKEAADATDGDPNGLKWEKIASLPEIMKAVPLINTRMKRYLRSESRLKKGADLTASYAAVLAVIAQGSLDSVSETEKPDEVDQWKAFCVEMRDLSAAMGTAVRKFEQDPTTEAFDAAKGAMETLNKNCEACHAVFKPDAVITDVEE